MAIGLDYSRSTDYFSPGTLLISNLQLNFHPRPGRFEDLILRRR